MSEANWGQMENRIAELEAENEKLHGLLVEWKELQWHIVLPETFRNLLRRTRKALK